MALAPTPQPRPAPSSAPRPAAAPAPKPSRLVGITESVVPDPCRFFFYGQPKVGKSTLAKDAPRPIFIDTMNGTKHLHVARYPVPVSGVWTWQDVLDALDDLLTNPSDYKTVVIEDVGDMEAIIHRHVCSTHKAGEKENAHYPTTIEGYGFGKGYNIAVQYWRILSARLDALVVKRKMHVIILGHSTVKNFKNPKGDDYDTWQPQIHKDAAGVLAKDFDVIGFITYDTATKWKGKGQKPIGDYQGLRIIHREYNAAWPMAGGRLPTDSDIIVDEEHPFRPFLVAMEQLYATADTLRSGIETELHRLGDTFVKPDGVESTAAKVREAVKRTGDDHDTLSKFLTLLRQAQPLTATETTP